MPAQASTSTLSLPHDESRPASIKASEKAYKSEMMFIGEQCHLSTCQRESFLPFRCPDCHHQFCSDHCKTSDHSCARASGTFLIPLCPLCHEPPKNWKRDEDPNIAMNDHLSPHPRTGRIECNAIDANGVIREDAKGRQRREKKPNECQEKRCRKLMIVPIKCPLCLAQFCPSHRAPLQHSCSPTQSGNSKSSTISSSLLNLLPKASAPAPSPSKATKPLNNDASPSSMSPLQAINSARKDLRTDKRARSEHASAIKALQARHEKGLLTPAEEIRLAEEMALLHAKQESSSNKDCIIA